MVLRLSIIIAWLYGIAIDGKKNCLHQRNCMCSVVKQVAVASLLQSLDHISKLYNTINIATILEIAAIANINTDTHQCQF